MLCELERHRICHYAEQLCHRRNQSLPVEQGKAFYVVSASSSNRFMLIFSQAVFSVDSRYEDHQVEVAKLQYDDVGQQWHLLVASDDKQAWQAHPYCPVHIDVQHLLTIVEHDPQQCIWT